MIRNVALLLVLTLAHPALAQTAPTAPTATHTPAKPAARKPAPPKPGAGATAGAIGAAQQGPCIGVISRIGDSFAVQNIGFTAFGNDLKKVPIESWGLDDLVVARIRAAVGPRIAVRRIAYPSNAFDAFDHPPFQLFRNRADDLKTVVRAITRPRECERYVVVLKGSDQFADTNQGVEGLGILNKTGIGAKTYLFAMSTIIVLDGHTYDVLKTSSGSNAGQKQSLGSLLGAGLHGPNRELEDFSWPPAPDAVLGLREPTRALLADSLDRALPQLLAP